MNRSNCNERNLPVSAKPYDSRRATIKWASLFQIKNWKPLLTFSILIILFGYSAVCWPLPTLTWVIGLPLSIISSVFLHETGHGMMAHLLGFKVQRLFVVGGGRRLWKSKGGAFVVKSPLIQEMELGDDGNGRIYLGFDFGGYSAFARDYTKPAWKMFLVVVAGPVVNLILGFLAFEVGFYPLVLVSAVYLLLAMFAGGSKSDGGQMWSILTGEFHRA